LHKGLQQVFDLPHKYKTKILLRHVSAKEQQMLTNWEYGARLYTKL